MNIKNKKFFLLLVTFLIPIRLAKTISAVVSASKMDRNIPICPKVDRAILPFPLVAG